jgi:hypothetical protein
MLTVFVMGLFAIGGDDFASAVQITSFPYTDTGDTTTLTSVLGNSSNDAFYLINSSFAILDLDISLEFSSYDTYLRVYAADQTTQLWSNDDFYDANSALFDLTLDADTDYYIIVEGYSNYNGAYQIDVTAVLDNPVAPVAISNIAPADEATYLNPATTLSWDFGANTETYDLYFDTVNPPVAMPVDNAVAGAAGAYDPGTLAPSTTYYWQVVSRNTATRLEVVSPVYSFTTWASNPNYGGDGTLYGGYYYANSTVDGDGFGYQPTFDWVDISPTGSTPSYSSADDGYVQVPIGFTFNYFGNDYTDIYIGTNGYCMFTNPTGSTGTSITIPNSDTPNDVIAMIAMDLHTSNVPSTPYYGNDADGNFVYTVEMWNDYNDNNEYMDVQLILYPSGRIKIQYKNYFNGDVESGSDTIHGDACIGIENIDGSIGHQYRNNGDGGPLLDDMALCYSPVMEGLDEPFVDPFAVPNPTTLIAPADGAVDQLTGGTLQWNAVLRTDGYDLYLGTDNPPTNIVNGVDQGNVTSYTYSGLNGGTTYYWQVVPYNTNGDAVGASVWSFTTAATPPNPVTYIAPADEVAGQDFDVTLSWNTDALADGYYLNFGTDNPPTNVENMTDMGTTTIYAATGLAGNTTYYWEVIPYNVNGNATGYATWSFTTYANTPSEIALTTPADLATGVSEYTTFTWTGDAWAFGYNLYIGTDGVNYVQTDVGNLTGVTLTTPLNYETMYYWYVTGYNPNGEGAAPAAVRTFTVQSNQNFGGDGTLYGGYYFANSEAAGNGLGSQPTFNWVDISATGSTPTYSSADDGHVVVPIGFTFNYFGVDYTEISIGTNGFCTLGSVSDAWNNFAIPSSSVPNGMLAILATDLHTTQAATLSYYGNDAEGNFVFTVEVANDQGDANEYMDIQMILYPNGRIKYQYRNYFNGDAGTDSSTLQNSSCIGIENADGTVGHQYRLNNVGGSILDNMAICYATTAEGLAEPAGALDTPTNVVLTYSGGLMNLTWDAVAGATLYNVYAAETPDFVADGTTFFQTVATNALAMDPSLLPGSHYFVKVTADQEVVRSFSNTSARRSYRTYGFVKYIEPVVVPEKSKK